MKRNRRPRPPAQAPSTFAGFRFPPSVILLAVRWYLRYGLSHRDLEELLAERGIEVVLTVALFDDVGVMGRDDVGGFGNAPPGVSAGRSSSW